MDRARLEAKERGVSLAGLVRIALDRLLAESTLEERRRRARNAVGGFRSGRTDIGEHHDQALAETGW